MPARVLILERRMVNQWAADLCVVENRSRPRPTWPKTNEVEQFGKVKSCQIRTAVVGYRYSSITDV